MKVDKADLLLHMLGYENRNITFSDYQINNLFKEVIVLVEEIGEPLNKKEYDLILHNDEINTTVFIEIQLRRVANLPEDDSIRVMNEAHTKGVSLIKKGTLSDIIIMKKELEDHSLTTSIRVCK